MKNKAQLIHDLAIIEYGEYYEKMGFEVVNPKNESSKYTPDLIIKKPNNNDLYIEFKSSTVKLNNNYFEYKDKILRENPMAEFSLIVLNDSYRPGLSVKFPFLKSLLNEAFQEEIERKLKTDKNYIGKFEILSFTINDMIIDTETFFKGTGIITYSIYYEEEKTTVWSKGIEISFNYMIKISCTNFLLINKESIIDKKIDIDKIR